MPEFTPKTRGVIGWMRSLLGVSWQAVATILVVLVVGYLLLMTGEKLVLFVWEHI